ncbi:MAG: phage major capsid protein, partial [Candidatus Methanomethylophilaceae archaeon]|nr:phage major capsid protein [Candidatus Methanomethylophilaceae archaeon]
MKAYLEKVVSDKEAQIQDLARRSEASQSIEEVRSIEKQIVALKDEITEARAQIAKLDAEARAKTEFQPMKALESVEMKSAKKDDDEMEYRKAFMEYAQHGTLSPILKRSGDRITSGDLGVMVPQTVMNEIIKGVEKKYGQLYGRVRKTSIKGGVKYPIGAFSATFHRLTEESTGAAPSARQAAGAITGYVEFSYNVGEIRIATSLLASVLEVPAFEREVINTIVEGYVKAMDKEIMTGVAASHQCVGILTEAAASPSRIPAGNTITFTAAEVMDWKEW